MATQQLLKKEWFVQKNQKKFDEVYLIDKQLGEGAYGTVFIAKMKDQNIKRAVKKILKSKVFNPAELINEINILQTLDHPHVIKLYEVYDEPGYLYLVMELLQGGELFDKIVDSPDQHLTENDTRNLFRQMVQAVNYCHQKQIVHRDLKPENCILLDKSPDSPIKIIDFGMSCLYQQKGEKQNLTSKVGSAFYIAPEVLEGKYDERCDNFSLGVILYIMLSGLPPFYGKTDAIIFKRIKELKYTMDIAQFQGVSDQAKDLIQKLLVRADNRLSASQILEHEWMKIDLPNVKLAIDFQSLKQFSLSSKMKRVALSFVASQMNDGDVQQLSETFKQLDVNNDGVLSLQEIKKGLENKTSPENMAELEQIFNNIDTDASGFIDYHEFIAASLDLISVNKTEYLLRTFKIFDQDGSGKIDKSELKKILGQDEKFKDYDEKYWDELIRDMDINGDGEIDYNEFISFMNNTVKK